MPQQHRPVVIGNWKLNGSFSHLQTYTDYLLGASMSGIPNTVDCGICLPYVYLAEAQKKLTHSGFGWGAEDVSEHLQGAYTGQISATMLAELGCRYTLVGHSERRQYQFEMDNQITRKAMQLVDCGIRPIYCLGENLQQRQSNQAEQVVDNQLQALLSVNAEKLTSVIIAYEPIWAIGTGQTATPEQAQHMHEFIATKLAAVKLNLPILYGGSVSTKNAPSLARMPNINGFLVGGASLEASSFCQICEVFR